MTTAHIDLNQVWRCSTQNNSVCILSRRTDFVEAGRFLPGLFSSTGIRKWPANNTIPDRIMVKSKFKASGRGPIAQKTTKET